MLGLDFSLAPVLAMSVAVAAFLLLSASGRCLANSAPQFASISDLYVSEGQLISLIVRATDTDGDPLSLSVSRRPSGSRFTDQNDGSGLFTWQPDFVGPLSSSAAPFALEFVVSDGLAQSILTLNVFVQNINRPPVITSPDSIAIEVGESINFQPTVFDPDFEAVSWRAIEVPAGGMFETSGVEPSPVNFSWSPDIADSGFSQLTLVATDELGLSDTTSTSIHVSVGAAYVLTIETDTVFSGEFLKLRVNLKNTDSLSAFDIAINLDPSVMVVLSVSNGATRTSGFEFFTFEFDNPNPGDLRIAGRADVNDGELSPPLAPGDGEIFGLNLKISSQSGLAGLFLPVKFGARNPFDTFTVSLSRAEDSEVGAADIELNNGGAKLRDKSDISIGDINLNGISFEISDALRFTNFFIDPIRYQFNSQQYANSDINGDGFTASIADLVALLGVIISGGAPRRVAGAHLTATLFTQQAGQHDDLSTNAYVNSEADLGAALLIFSLDSEFSSITREINNTPGSILLSSELADAGMLLKSNLDGDTLRILIYSETSGVISAGRKRLLTLDYFETAMSLVSAELATADGARVSSNIATGGKAALPASFTLNQNYPNPFNPSTKITFTLDQPAQVKLQIYDVLGRAVRNLIEESLPAGEHTVVWNSANDSGLPAASGVYVYRLSANNRAVSKKMTLLK